MRDEISSTAQYLAMVIGLRQKIADADRRAAELRNMLQQMLTEFGEPSFKPADGEVRALQTKPADTAIQSMPPAPTLQKIDLTGLMIGDACVAVLGATQRPMRNREILDALLANGYDFGGAKDPINNVTSAMGHRYRSARDIEKVNRLWVTKKSESPAIREASHMNGAAVQPA